MSTFTISDHILHVLNNRNMSIEIPRTDEENDISVFIGDIELEKTTNDEFDYYRLQSYKFDV